jgi:hypothetical protein
MDLYKLKASLIGIIINEVIDDITPIAGSTIRAIFPTMDSTVKYDFVHSTTIDMTSRMLLCCYDPEENDPELPDSCLHIDPAFASIMSKNASQS